MHENTLMAYLLAFLIGGVAGLRTFTPLALVSWGSFLGKLHLGATWLAFLSSKWTLLILTLLAAFELVYDQLPSAPSRTEPQGLTARVVSGAVSGAAVGTAGGAMVGGMIAGIAGAVVYTLAGHAFRIRLATAFRRDRPGAFIEDAIALGSALAIGMSLR